MTKKIIKLEKHHKKFGKSFYNRVRTARGYGFESHWWWRIFCYKSFFEFFYGVFQILRFFSVKLTVSPFFSQILDEKIFSKNPKPRQFENLANWKLWGGPLDFKLARFDKVELFLLNWWGWAQNSLQIWTAYFMNGNIRCIWSFPVRKIKNFSS